MKPPNYTLDEDMIADDAANGAAIQTMRGDMKQKELAEALGISASYLCDMEAGKRHLSYPLFNQAKAAILKHNGK